MGLIGRLEFTLRRELTHGVFHLLRVWLSMPSFRELNPEHPTNLRAGMQCDEQGA